MVEGISPVSSIINIPSNFQFMSSEAENNEPQSGNMEQVEDKVNVEEATINLGCVKRELEEGEFDENRYKFGLTFENIFGQSSSKPRDNRDSLISFLDDEVIMETGTIKLEDVKEERDLIRDIMEPTNCNECGGNYEGYCPDCSSLYHILNNLTPNIKPEPILNTTPINMLEIRELSTRPAVFALKTFPKGIIMGPFEGVSPIESTTGLQWKIKDKKLANDQNGNWMKYIESVGKHASKNLDVFQFDRVLYFETSRDVQEGEELLVCYREEEEDSDNAEEFYLTPVKKEKFPKVFACTLCCLGFRLGKCLLEHKSKCSRGNHADSTEDFEIIQCRCCKVWLEKHEHLENHMLHCRNYDRSCRNRNLRHFPPINTEEEEEEKDEITASIDVDASYSTHPTEIIDSDNCFSRTDFKVHKEDLHDEISATIHSNTNEKTHKYSECSYQTNLKGHLKTHLDTHTDVKDFECDICKQRFGQNSYLKRHIKNKHSNTNEKKEYKCSQCSFQTNHKSNFKVHLGTHTGDKQHFQCDICKKRFGYKNSLQLHIRTQHSNTSEMEYKCSECSFQTNWKSSFKIHLDTHSDIKNFQCDICKQRFGRKSYLKEHIKNHHSNTNEKDYKCSECSYQTNHKGHLKTHLDTHTGIKDFECDICKKRFTEKGTLQRHIKNKHSNANEKEYKCSECSFQTNWKSSFKFHLDTHSDIKHFECDICKQRFSQTGNLKVHMKNKHSNTNEKKEYKCTECFYQTNYKGNLKSHLGTHTSVKNFECDICKQTFTQKGTLQRHIKNKH